MAKANLQNRRNWPRWRLEAQEFEEILLRWPSTYEWRFARKWVEPLLYGFQRLIKTEIADLAQPYRGIVLIQFVSGGTVHDVAIDYYDHPDINEACAKGVVLKK